MNMNKRDIAMLIMSFIIFFSVYIVGMSYGNEKNRTDNVCMAKCNWYMEENNIPMSCLERNIDCSWFCKGISREQYEGYYK